MLVRMLLISNVGVGERVGVGGIAQAVSVCACISWTEIVGVSVLVGILVLVCVATGGEGVSLACTSGCVDAGAVSVGKINRVGPGVDAQDVSSQQRRVIKKIRWLLRLIMNIGSRNRFQYVSGSE